ncbi:hypothetical protein [Paenibacillus sp. RC84]|uniref:phage baseplate plug family protein n=1 Tax=Paenibacillus sp. RC84 TaxID=3156252 RepID=UPI00351446BD
MQYIPIEKDLIPYRFDMSLAGRVYTFEVHYNEEFDFFTLDLELDEEVLVTGEKIVYEMPLFDGIEDSRFPQLTLVPFDESGLSNEVNWNTLNETVFIYLPDGDDDE